MALAAVLAVLSDGAAGLQDQQLFKVLGTFPFVVILWLVIPHNDQTPDA